MNEGIGRDLWPCSSTDSFEEAFEFLDRWVSPSRNPVPHVSGGQRTCYQLLQHCLEETHAEASFLTPLSSSNMKLEDGWYCMWGYSKVVSSLQMNVEAGGGCGGREGAEMQNEREVWSTDCWGMEKLKLRGMGYILSTMYVASSRVSMRAVGDGCEHCGTEYMAARSQHMPTSQGKLTLWCCADDTPLLLP
jgi:hypothetical protein